MKIEYSRQAQKAIERMDRAAKHRLRDAIEKLPAGDVKKLKGCENAYRLRVGDYRVLYDMNDGIEITNILPRGNAYKLKLRTTKTGKCLEMTRQKLRKAAKNPHKYGIM